MNKKILLTGGAGYIGSTVAHLLIENGFSVTIIDNFITGNKKLVPKKAKLIVSDIADEKKILSKINLKSFDLVMHFAGLIRVDESLKKPKKYIIYNYHKSKVFIKMCLKNSLNKRDKIKSTDIEFKRTNQVGITKEFLKKIVGKRLKNKKFVDEIILAKDLL